MHLSFASPSLTPDGLLAASPGRRCVARGNVGSVQERENSGSLLGAIGRY